MRSDLLGTLTRARYSEGEWERVTSGLCEWQIGNASRVMEYCGAHHTRTGEWIPTLAPDLHIWCEHHQLQYRQDAADRTGTQADFNDGGAMSPTSDLIPFHWHITATDPVPEIVTYLPGNAIISYRHTMRELADAVNPTMPDGARALRECAGGLDVMGPGANTGDCGQHWTRTGQWTRTDLGSLTDGLLRSGDSKTYATAPGTLTVALTPCVKPYTDCADDPDDRTDPPDYVSHADYPHEPGALPHGCWACDALYDSYRDAGDGLCVCCGFPLGASADTDDPFNGEGDIIHEVCRRYLGRGTL